MRRRGTHQWPLRARCLKQNGGGSGRRRRAIACAADRGPRPREVTNLLVFCPAATISASMLAFSSILSLNLTIPCHSLASPKKRLHPHRSFTQRLLVGLGAPVCSH